MRVFRWRAWLRRFGRRPVLPARTANNPALTLHERNVLVDLVLIVRRKAEGCRCHATPGPRPTVPTASSTQTAWSGPSCLSWQARQLAQCPWADPMGILARNQRLRAGDE